MNQITIKVKRVVSGTYKVQSSDGRVFFISRDRFPSGRPNGWKWESGIFQTTAYRYGLRTLESAKSDLLRHLNSGKGK
jgi:hypothetical protein